MKLKCTVCGTTWLLSRRLTAIPTEELEALREAARVLQNYCLAIVCPSCDQMSHSPDCELGTALDNVKRTSQKEG
jgi:hypothetical protein